MNAKEFRLKNGKYEPRFTTEKRYVLYEADEVERLMEEYHQSKVNNVALDGVSNLFDHKTIERIRNSSSDAEARRIFKTLWLK
jgi:hypothetical protein